MVVTVANEIVLSGRRHEGANVVEVVDKHPLSTEFQAGGLPSHGHVRRGGGQRGDPEAVPIVVAKDEGDRSGEPLAELPNHEW
jgi:hypothetical protein